MGIASEEAEEKHIEKVQSGCVRAIWEERTVCLGKEYWDQKYSLMQQDQERFEKSGHTI